MTISLMMHSFFLVCYYYEFEFIESYNVTNEPWPWKSEDRTEWNRILRKTIALYLFNLMVVGPLAISPLIIFDLNLDIGTSLDGVPTRTAFLL